MDTKKTKSKRGGRRPGSGRKPGTPNKTTAVLKEIAGQYTESAIKTLAAIMDDPEAPAAARVSAADKLLDRGHGRPTQTIDATLEQKGVDTQKLSEQYLRLAERSCSRQIEMAEDRRELLGDDQADQLIKDAKKRLERVKREANQ